MRNHNVARTYSINSQPMLEEGNRSGLDLDYGIFKINNYERASPKYTNIR
jgi:hypothetical protein